MGTLKINRITGRSGSVNNAPISYTQNIFVLEDNSIEALLIGIEYFFKIYGQ